jgi:hypothetical protein
MARNGWARSWAVTVVLLAGLLVIFHLIGWGWPWRTLIGGVVIAAAFTWVGRRAGWVK